jgi:hypothetical protein
MRMEKITQLGVSLFTHLTKNYCNDQAKKEQIDRECRMQWRENKLIQNICLKTLKEIDTLADKDVDGSIILKQN